MAKASASSRNLSGILIAGAFSLIGISLYVAANFIDKSNSNGIFWGSIWAGLAVLACIISIIAGGRGMTQNLRNGLAGHFNIQATAGLIGLLLFAISAAVFAFSPK